VPPIPEPGVLAGGTASPLSGGKLKIIADFGDETYVLG
jgi:hypothetical protein